MLTIQLSHINMILENIYDIMHIFKSSFSKGSISYDPFAT